MVALADNLVEISTQLPRYEDALDKRCDLALLIKIHSNIVHHEFLSDRAFVLEVSNNYGSVSHKVRAEVSWES